VIATIAALAGAAAYTALARTSTGSLPFFAFAAIGAVAYITIVFTLCRRAQASRLAVAVSLVLALVARVPLVGAGIGAQSDIYRYIWDARVQQAGLNPYMVKPDSPDIAWLHTVDTRRMNNPDVPSPYPPAAQLFFRIVAAVDESPRTFKLALTACDLAVMVVLVAWLRSTARPEAWVLAYAWHPLAILETAGEGHLDVAGLLLLLCAVLALTRRAAAAATVGMTLAAAFKFLPIVLAPLLWKRIRLQHAALAAVVLAALYLPYLHGTTLPIGSVADVVRRFRFNSPVFDLMEGLAPAWVLTAAAVVAGMATAALLWHRGPGDPSAWAWPMAIAMLLSPLVYPWYLLWLTPFLIARGTAPLGVWSLAILLTYSVWANFRLGAEWRVPSWILFAEYGALVATCTWYAVRRMLFRQPDGDPARRKRGM
jgi:alpha-1,6-mannosyltransferase